MKIEIKNVSKEFKGIEILHDLNATFEEMEAEKVFF